MKSNDVIVDEDVSIEKLNNQELLSYYHEVEAFLKMVDEELKKTDVGDDNE
jgi:hypothetical protein